MSPNYANYPFCIESPSNAELADIWQRRIIDDPRERRNYTASLPATDELLTRRRIDYRPCIVTQHRGNNRVVLAVQAAHDVIPYTQFTTGWTMGWVAHEARGPENADLRTVMMQVVVERWYEYGFGIEHLFAAVISANRAGNRWASDIGFTRVGRFPNFLRLLNGELGDHDIYCWKAEDMQLAWHDANRRTQGGVKEPFPEYSR